MRKSKQKIIHQSEDFERELLHLAFASASAIFAISAALLITCSKFCHFLQRICIRIPPSCQQQKSRCIYICTFRTIYRQSLRTCSSRRICSLLRRRNCRCIYHPCKRMRMGTKRVFRMHRCNCICRCSPCKHRLRPWCRCTWRCMLPPLNTCKCKCSPCSRICRRRLSVCNRLL